MAIFYSLNIGRPATTEQVREALTRGIDTHALARAGHASRVDEDYVFLAGGGWVFAHTRSSLPFLDPMEESYGFVPTVYVGFRMGDPQRSLEQEHGMVELLAAALTGVDGDAWFGFNGEITYLTRIGGRITVDTGEPFWTPELVALLPPHDSARLPNM